VKCSFENTKNFIVTCYTANIKSTPFICDSVNDTYDKLKELNQMGEIDYIQVETQSM
jgi:hypothetical protein